MTLDLYTICENANESAQKFKASNEQKGQNMENLKFKQ